MMSRRIRSSCWRCKPFPPPSERDLWSWMRRGYRCDGAITRTSVANAAGVPRTVWNMFARHGGVTEAHESGADLVDIGKHRAVGGDLPSGCSRAGRAPAEAERKVKIGFRTEFRTDFGQRLRSRGSGEESVCGEAGDTTSKRGGSLRLPPALIQPIGPLFARITRIEWMGSQGDGLAANATLTQLRKCLPFP